MYSSDSPIQSRNDDLLNRATFVKNLTQSIVNNRSSDTFCLGLYGEWGSGKTSILNMVVQELTNPTENIQSIEIPIIVQFNPWNFSSTDHLLKQFFLRLYNELCSSKDKKLAEVGAAIEKYSTAIEIVNLVPYVGGVFTTLGKTGLTKLSKKLKAHSISDVQDITEQKDKVIELLRNQSRKIIIIIDDIDRLSNEEIRLIFKLVNSVARFPNTMYILSFDRDIVAKALEQVQDGDGNDYLEKIIQIPIEIPMINKNKLHQVLFNKLDELLKEYQDVTFDIPYWQRAFSKCVEPFIENLRDINRIYNVMSFKLSSIQREVNFVDIVAISTLEICCPPIYQWINNNKSILVNDVLAHFSPKKKSSSEWRDHYEVIIKDILSTSPFRNQTEAVIKCLSCLFSRFGNIIGEYGETSDNDELRRNKRIGHPEKFDLYFHLNINNVVLSRDEIDLAIFQMDTQELIDYVLNIDLEDKIIYFLEELRSAIKQIDTERATIISTVLFQTAVLFESKSTSGFFAIGPATISELLIRDLVQIIDSKKRFDYIKRIIQSADLNCIQIFSVFLNTTELAFGRLAANGEEKDYKKLINLSELEIIEQLFCVRVKELLTENNVLDFKHSRMVVYLMECFDPSFCKSYFSEKYFTPINTLKYLSLSAIKWTGVGTEWEFKDDYKKYLSDEKVLLAIEQVLYDKTFWELSEDVKNSVAAFYLQLKKEKNIYGHISQSSIENIIKEWQLKGEMECPISN